MAKKKAAPQSSVADILNRSQESIAGHSKYAKLLWQVEAADSDTCYKELFKCLSYMLTVPQKTNANVERALHFIATFTAEVPERSDDSCTIFIQDVVADLVLLSEAVDKNVRMRACSLLAAIMQRVTVDMADDILDKLQEAMLGRLRDKVPQVRMYAALVLERLAEAGEDENFTDDPVTSAYRKLLEVERNKDVRKCVLGAMVIVAGTTVVDLLERTNDVSDVVRKQAFTVLATKCNLSALTVEQRALVLRRGLRDRSPNVLAAAQRLLQIWLADACKGDVFKLLEALDVQVYPDEAEEAMKALTAAGHLALYNIAEEAQENSTGLRRPAGSACLSSEEAFFWRWVCEYLHAEGDARGKAAAATRGAEAEAEAAAASDCLQALEAALPASVADLVDLVAAHAAHGQHHAFATSQLLQIASHCVDMTDASGREAAAELLHKLLRQHRATGTDDAWGKSVLDLAKQALSGPNEVASYLMDAITELRTSFNLCTGSGSAEDWCHILSLASMLFQQVPTLRMAGTFGTGNSPADLFGSLIFPALGQPFLDVRAAAVRCLGLYCQLGTAMLQSAPQATPDQILSLVSLRTFLTHSEHRIKCMAARALCDLALTRGPKILDACHTQLVEHPRDYLPATLDPAAVAEAAEQAAQDSQPLLELLLLQLPGLWATSGRTKTAKQEAVEGRELGSIIAEGLAKLVMHQGQWKADSPCRLEDAEIALVLSRLLAAYSDPATEPATAARQCLSIFFPAYAAYSGTHHKLLCQAVLPAARWLLAQGPSVAKSAAPNLLRFMLQLLQTPLASGDDQPADLGYSGLAQQALAEILACDKGAAAKPYVSALLKLLLGLPLKSAPQASMKALRVLADHVKAVYKDGTVGKDAASLSKRLTGWDVTPTEMSQALSEEAVAEVLAAAERHGQSADLPFAARAVNPTPGPIASRPRASHCPAIVDRHDSTSSEDDEVDEDEDEGQRSDDDNLSGDENAPLAETQPPAMATRAVRKGKACQNAEVAVLQENVQGLQL